MSTHITVLLEQRTENGWGLLIERTPASEDVYGDHWYYDLVDERVKTGAGMVLSASLDENEQREAAEKYFASLNINEAIERFGDDPAFLWDYHTPDVLHFQQYRWFQILHALGTPGYPDDMCSELKHRISRTSESFDPLHLTLDVVNANHLITSRFAQARWVRENVRNPEDVRMVVYFS